MATPTFSPVRPLVHVGMAKAASTFLQHEIFPKLDAVEYLGKHHCSPELTRSGAALVRRTSLDWSTEAFAPPFQEAVGRALMNGKLPVYSEEDLSVFKFLDPETMIQRLRAIIGPFDVLFVVRHPLTWLRSHYLFRLSNLERDAVFGFDAWFRHHQDRVGIGSDHSEIRFAHLAEVYRQTCGGQVHVVPYELLKLDPARFAAELGRITGVGGDAILELMNARPDKKRHKLAITDVERRAFEAARWVVLQQPDRVKTELQALLAEQSLTATDAIWAEIDALAAQSGEVQAGAALRAWRPAFARLMREIEPQLGKAASAKPDLSEESADVVARVLKRQLSDLGSGVGKPLAGLPVAYTLTDAVAA